MFDGDVSVSSRIFHIRAANICVFPVPGPAITITGPSILSTALRWFSFSFAYSLAKCLFSLSRRVILFKGKLRVSAHISLKFTYFPLFMGIVLHFGNNLENSTL